MLATTALAYIDGDEDESRIERSGNDGEPGGPTWRTAGALF